MHRLLYVYRGVLQGLPEPNRAWLLGNRSLTPVASGRPLVYQVT